MGSRILLGVAPKVARTDSCSISERPNVATMESDAEFSTGRMTTRSIRAPKAIPSSGTIRKAIQKLPVIRMIVQANTVPIMKKSPWATLMMSSSPKMIDRPRAMRAMISPQTRPFMARMSKRSESGTCPPLNCRSRCRAGSRPPLDRTPNRADCRRPHKGKRRQYRCNFRHCNTKKRQLSRSLKTIVDNT